MQIFFLNHKFKILIFLILLIIIFYRSPYILLNGRFYAEEGSFWFRNSYLFGPIVGITQVFWGSSYFNIWPNIATVFASFVPLEYAPLVTVYFALFVKVYLFFFIIFSKSIFIKTNLDRFLISLIILVSPAMIPSIWLNTLTSQISFTIICIFIIFQNEDYKNKFNYFSPVILLISSLSSVLPLLLTPFYLVKFLTKKNKFNFINLTILILTGLFQSFIFLFSKLNNLDLAGEQTRFLLSFEKLINFYYNVLAKPIFGRELTQMVYFKFMQNINFIVIILIFSLLMIVYLSKNLKSFKKDKIFIILLMLFILNSLFAFFGSKMLEVQGRYAVVPAIILILSIYRLSQITEKINKFFCLTIIIISISAGFYEFKNNNKFSHYLVCINCPDWKKEVSKWKKNKTYLLEIWPYGRKKMRLY